MRLLRPHYFYNAILLILFSACIYVITSQAMYPIPTSHLTGTVIKTSITSERRINPKYSVVISNSSGDADGTHPIIDQYLTEFPTTSPSESNDWLKLFQDTAQKFYQMLTPDYLDKFREWAIDKERGFLAEEMENYEFVEGKHKKLSDFVPETGGKPIRNIIFSTWRSGSTFLGEIMDAHPGTYYHYEPLLHFGTVQVRSGPLAQEGLRVIRNLLHCQYSNLTEYMKFGQDHHWVYNHNSRLWKFCEKNHEVCWDTEFLAKMCRLFPFQSIKTVRMRLGLAKPLLEDKELDVRLLLLVRDPRGTLQSRFKRVDFCPQSPDCESPRNLCSDLEADFQAAARLREKYPGKFMALRYEDISLNPDAAVKKLFSFFRLSVHPAVQNYLDIHTVSDNGGMFSTFRDSKSTPFHWRKDLLNDFGQVKRIQLQCAKAMSLWGYRLAKDKFDMMTSNPLQRPPWKEMLIP